MDKTYVRRIPRFAYIYGESEDSPYISKMTIKEILSTTHHCPWPLPKESWQFYQEWNKAIFLHWQVDEKELRKFVPSEIEIDLFEYQAWVSLVAFSMEKVRPKYLPAFSPVSNFHEINIRTYVKINGKTGVYFLSIEGGKSLSCKLAKGLSGLPYRFSKMKRTGRVFSSKNNVFGDTFDIQYKSGNALKTKSDLDIWLTERYAVIQDAPIDICTFDVHHLEWPVQEVEIENLSLNYQRFNKLINNTPDKTHYSKGVQVLAWNKKETE